MIPPQQIGLGTPASLGVRNRGEEGSLFLEQFQNVRVLARERKAGAHTAYRQTSQWDGKLSP